MIPELLTRKADGLLRVFCQRNAGRLACPHVDLVYEWAGAAVTLMFRDGCNAPQPIARFRYSSELCQWALFSPGTLSGWRPCLDIPPTLNFENLLSYLEEDPLKMFWPAAFTCFS
jgi:hypothetical protein